MWRYIPYYILLLLPTKAPSLDQEQWEGSSAFRFPPWPPSPFLRLSLPADGLRMQMNVIREITHLGPSTLAKLLDKIDVNKALGTSPTDAVSFISTHEKSSARRADRHQGPTAAGAGLTPDVTALSGDTIIRTVKN